MNLFKAYKVVKDEPFLEYIRGLQNGHEDGTSILTSEQLMNKAVNFYKTRITHNEWEELSWEQKGLVTLAARVAKFKKQRSPSVPK